MNRSNCTNIKQFEGGRVVKQGDSASLFGFELYDERWAPIDLNGHEATIHFVSKKGKASFSATVQGSKVTFKIPKVLPVESYLVEVECEGYVFPSDQSVRVDVVQSAEQYQSTEMVELGKVSLRDEIANYLAGHAVEAYNDGPLVARIEALEARPQVTTVDLGPLERRVQALESRPAPNPAVDLSAYMTSEMAYQTFATYTTLQAQMTSNIKNKHLELGLDALIDEKLRNGGDNFLTSHQASTAYASKEEFQNLLKRVEVLESVPI
nr:MAG TPA: hypothetical protein [Caudoviricetes sp.]